MARPHNWELKYLTNAAFDSADEFGEKINSLQLLFAIFMFTNSGRMLFEELRISEDILINFSGHGQQEPEKRAEEVLELAENIASKYGDVDVNILHMIVALCRTPDCMAYRVMKSAGVNISNLRTRSVSHLANMPERYLKLFQQHSRLTTANARRTSSAGSRPQASASQPTAQATQIKKSVSLPEMQTQLSFNSQSMRQQAEPEGVLDSIATDMLKRATNGEFEDVCGHNSELEEMLDVLNKRRVNSPLIVGPPGVGKTALVEGLAYRLANLPGGLAGFEGRRLMQLEPMRLLQGANMRGALAKRMDALREEIESAGEKVVFFVDELYRLSQTGSESTPELGNEFKSALMRGDFSCIGTASWDEYKSHIEKDPAFSRHFHLIELKEPDEAETLDILRQAVPSYEAHHRVGFDEEALLQSIRLSNRYMHDRHQPDKALSLLDMAASRAHREGRESVDVRLIADLVAQIAEVPTEQLVISEMDRYLKLEEKLSERIIGHKDALNRLAEVLRRNAAGFRGERPIGSFMFAGPTGIGKTETAKALACELFGSDEHMVRIDMSEYSESHSIARLIGAPPGYVGYSEGGQLTEALRRKPFQIVLLDEIEKSHSEVMQILLQVLDEGKLTDGQGRKVDFSNSIIIMTSNLGSHLYDKTEKRSIGFGSSSDEEKAQSDTKIAVLDVIKAAFPPELYNRIDEKVVFDRLTRNEVMQVADLLLNITASKILRERRIKLLFGDGLTEFLVAHGGYEPRYGARPMRRAVQRMVEGPLAACILRGEFKNGDTVMVQPSGDSLGFLKK